MTATFSNQQKHTPNPSTEFRLLIDATHLLLIDTAGLYKLQIDTTPPTSSGWGNVTKH